MILNEDHPLWGQLKPTFDEWHNSRRRSMGCVAATDWFCKKHPDFAPKRMTRGEGADLYQHVIATNGEHDVDMTPHLFSPDDGSGIPPRQRPTIYSPPLTPSQP